MKVLSFAIIALLGLLQQVNAQTNETTLNTMTGESATELDLTSSTAPREVSPFSEGTLDLPVMRERLTITESSQNRPLLGEDIDETYVQMMQDFAATHEDNKVSPSAQIKEPELDQLLSTLIVFFVEAIITLIVLKITFRLGEHRARLKHILPISLVIATVGALLQLLFDLSPFNPIQVSLSSILLLMLIRLATNVHEWAAALQITIATRLISLGVMWLTFTSIILLLGL
ncbi:MULTISPECIES: hypothetical protein [unclassified Lentimonas]|uniref:hypothetical protein n=1 Tax=unclassified Lentimonas TaxID=2630993 RepID=UPI0013230A2F|nr:MULTISPECIES: hypothetical protein [unclassified Lentimonas]CAA6678844.1 Unannotated [Lentimonas sp. CC4]CAA6684448.1 Unannotated [Lentimonas sp. CC6]CAA7077473.1 Unannotated [Lentimonas sp. CC4]CAA7171307.1 Unannotated [Lentimonas sp. CC21]CAA7183337.1 Unannotated [Lentimonas sp. CC8]